METTYKPEAWRDLFVMIGTSAGALVGLLFIVMSLHLEKISERADDNMRATIDGAYFNTIHLLAVLVEAAVVLTPQPLPFIGAELVAINTFGLRGPLLFTYRYLNKNITISSRSSFPLALIVTITVAYLVGIAGGAAAIEMLTWSLYLVAAACVVKIVRAVLTAWMLMFGMLHARPLGDVRRESSPPESMPSPAADSAPETAHVAEETQPELLADNERNAARTTLA